MTHTKNKNLKKSKKETPLSLKTGWSGHDRLAGWFTGRVGRPRGDSKKQVSLERFLVSGSGRACLAWRVGGIGRLLLNSVPPHRFPFAILLYHLMSWFWVHNCILQLKGSFLRIILYVFI